MTSFSALVRQSGHSDQEIAELLGLTPAMVRQRLLGECRASPRELNVVRGLGFAKSQVEMFAAASPTSEIGLAAVDGAVARTPQREQRPPRSSRVEDLTCH